AFFFEDVRLLLDADGRSCAACWAPVRLAVRPGRGEICWRCESIRAALESLVRVCLGSSVGVTLGPVDLKTAGPPALLARLRRLVVDGTPSNRPLVLVRRLVGLDGYRLQALGRGGPRLSRAGVASRIFDRPRKGLRRAWRDYADPFSPRGLDE